jgi:peptidoglycan/LPS O-acetylase OafA/YrhL
MRNKYLVYVLSALCFVVGISPLFMTRKRTFSTLAPIVIGTLILVIGLKDRKVDLLSLTVGLCSLIFLMADSITVLPRTEFMYDFLFYTPGTVVLTLLLLTVAGKNRRSVHRRFTWPWPRVKQS